MESPCFGLTRPVGRPTYKPVVWYKSFLHQVAKVEFHLGELFPRIGFIVTNLVADNRAVVRFYNKRGTAEQWKKEGKQAVKMTRVSRHRFRAKAGRDRLQPGQPMAAAGAARAAREVVADQLAAAAGKNRRTFDQACPLQTGCCRRRVT
jgi:hypothetical protein